MSSICRRRRRVRGTTGHVGGRDPGRGSARRRWPGWPPSAPPIRVSTRSVSPAARAPRFTAIVEAFAKGDTAALKPLLDAQTFASFEAAIRAREAKNEKAETTLIGFEASDIAAAELQGNIATVTVRFVTEQVNATRNADGMIADGNPNEVLKVIDLWSFRRDVQSRDPNWLLVKTESEG